jgi:hypothetical protein
MTSAVFGYDKAKVIQALRYHFITRREIKVMIILVNVFALLSAVLYFVKKVSPQAFFIGSLLWILLMLMFWIILPRVVYRKAVTFQDHFQASFAADGFTLSNERGSRSWQWAAITTWMESPHFFHLYFNPRSFFIIPKDAFEGDNVHEARKILTAQINKKG